MLYQIHRYNQPAYERVHAVVIAAKDQIEQLSHQAAVFFCGVLPQLPEYIAWMKDRASMNVLRLRTHARWSLHIGSEPVRLKRMEGFKWTYQLHNAVQNQRS
jgi:hypothetical protein